jgi:predicted MFS family arabinose efflux permease
MDQFMSVITDNPTAGRVSAWTTIVLATACGVMATNLYAAQPLAGLIRADLGLSPKATGLIVTVMQVGYGAGLLLIVPLSDLVENRRLAIVMILLSALALLAAALAPGAVPFFVAALLIGFGTVAVQVLIPYAAQIAPEAERGRVVGNVMSGLLLGVMLARPVSSFIAARSSWHAVFFLSAAAMIVLASVLGLALPRHRPTSKLRYGELLASMGRLVATTPVLRRRTIYHACLGAAFGLFWTVTPLLLAGQVFQLSQNGIGLFALAGVSGAIAAPMAGRAADRGWGRAVTASAMVAVIGGFLMMHFVSGGGPEALGLLVAAAILVDFGVCANMAVGQRMIFSIGPALRGRLNGLYTAGFFTGSAAGAALGGWTFAQHGWPATAWVGVALPVAGFLYFLTD